MTVTDIQLQNGSGEIISISAMDYDFVLESVDWGVASISAYPVRYFPTENSERVLNTTWQQRPVSIIGCVIGKDESDIDRKRQRLDSFIEVQGETKILYNGYHLNFYPTKKVRFAFTEQDNNEAILRFQIEGTCFDPMWHNDTTVEESNLHEVPMFFFPLWFEQDEPRVVFGQQYGNVGTGNNQFANAKFHYPLILNEDIPAAVFGELIASTYNIIDYEGVLSTGVIIRIVSTGEIRGLTIQMEHDGSVYTFTLTGTYPANTEIVIDTREGFQNVSVGGVVIDVWDEWFYTPAFHFPLIFSDGISFGEAYRPEHVAAGSDWFRLRPGRSIFTFFYNSDGQLDTLVEVKQSSLFEVQT